MPTKHFGSVAIFENCSFFLFTMSAGGSIAMKRVPPSLRAGESNAGKTLLVVISTPPASKVHCSINGLENSSSPEYSKVQHFSGSAVELFSIGVELFSVRVELEKSSTPIEKVLLRSK